jgi:hypothetical protein
MRLDQQGSNPDWPKLRPRASELVGWGRSYAHSYKRNSFKRWTDEASRAAEQQVDITE